MKVALFALGGSFSHTNLAIRCLRPPLVSEGFEVQLIEGSLGDTDANLLDMLYFADADIYGFSAYIWNIQKMLLLAANLKKLCPEAKIIFGGPEVSYDTERFDPYDFIDCIICGEGESALCEVCSAIRAKKPFERIIQSPERGLTKGILYSPTEQSKKLMYYESSRGCPFSCAYCLSSAVRGVLSKSAKETLEELYEFEKFESDITIKLVDRTFNFDIARANAIWRGLLDEKYTKKYHFEICASLLNEESFDLLSRFPEGKIRLEVGLQSVNKKTLALCARHIDPEAVISACRRISDMKNIHLHLDLICGLPGDTFTSVGEAYDRAYSACSLLQVGFLKLLHGTALRRDAEKLGIKYKDEPPYEVLSTKELSYAELRRLHDISDLTERYRDGGKFNRSLEYIFSVLRSPFAFFGGLSEYISEIDGRSIRKIGQNDAYKLLFGYASLQNGIDSEKLGACLHADFTENEVHRAPYFLRKNQKLEKEESFHG